MGLEDDEYECVASDEEFIEVMRNLMMNMNVLLLMKSLLKL